MLEYFTYRKFKKHQAQKQEAEQKRLSQEAADTPGNSSNIPQIVEPNASATTTTEVGSPLLQDEDERFFRLLTTQDASLITLKDAENGDDDEGPRPPLPPRIKTPEIGWDSDAESFLVANKGKGKEKAGDEAAAPAVAEKTKDGDGKFTNRIGRRISVLVRRPGKKQPDVKPNPKLAVSEEDAEREKDDLTRVLDDLNLSAQNNRVFSLSKESTELVNSFTQVLKDLVNGVPTAANDLKTLLEDPDGHLAKNYEKLPGSLKKLVQQMPDKISGSLAPELLAAAAKSQGLEHTDNSKGGIKETAMKLIKPGNLQELITKPGAILSMLKAIVNALKLRWPAFIGTNVIWSIAIFLLLFVLWYCHKRGREVRLEGERTTEAGDRIEELPDDPLLPAPPAGEASGSASSPKLPQPPVGEGSGSK
ncbi:hypothetical protein PpBr36_00940 [Pyricularia pennisetigena]|uniref:hypothetical protein n=1 Tax=Pyricularia pennisetigena TaxID=1578925 RepID=UPI0011502BC5|nr:hypothetical protein PpBr36_00940 [Pyricularia pennisetigena]TLS29370.1 hypothetical protein PpBr36_00940 [Pyricularia pennisetigena]